MAQAKAKVKAAVRKVVKPRAKKAEAAKPVADPNKITAEDLDQHKLWWLSDGVKGKRLERPHANLSRANLDGANLSRANLDGANLDGANLSRANLDGANLDGANLSRANLSRANLSRANLDGANLSRANLDGANLDGANLSRANLDGANLSRANLSGANLDGAKLIGQQPVLSLQFAHGYILMLFRTDKGIRVHCGCRRFENVAAAKAHWLAHKNGQRRQVVLPALDALLVIAKAQGWEVK